MIPQCCGTVFKKHAALYLHLFPSTEVPIGCECNARRSPVSAEGSQAFSFVSKSAGFQRLIPGFGNKVWGAKRCNVRERLAAVGGRYENYFVFDFLGVKSIIKSPSRPLPPLPSRDPRTSPALRSISPRSTTVPPQLPFWPPVDTRDRSRSSLSRPAIANQATSSLLVSPVPRREPYSHQLQQDFIRRGRRPTPLRRRSATPDIKFQLHDLTGQITRDDENISEYGGYGSVWKGSLQPHGTKVCILEVL